MSGWQADPRPHQPLFVLRQHGSALLSSAFYPSTDLEWGQRGAERYTTTCRHSSRSRLFLSGDVSGHVILWDLEVRRPLVRFDAVDTATSEEREAEDGAFLTEEHAHQRRLRAAIAEATTATSSPVGVLAVGFVRAERVSGVPQEQAGDGARGGLTKQENQAQNGRCSLPTSAKGTDDPSSTSVGGTDTLSSGTNDDGADTENNSPSGRRRFRLTRRPANGKHSASSLSGAPAVALDSAPVEGANLLDDDRDAGDGDVVYFYTHCRNQRLYVWSFSLSRAPVLHSSAPHDAPALSFDADAGPSDALLNLSLLFSFHVPHHGFCPVASAIIAENSSLLSPSSTQTTEDLDHVAPQRRAAGCSGPTHYSTLLILPGDSGGARNGSVTAWKLSASPKATSATKVPPDGTAAGTPTETTTDRSKSSQREGKLQVSLRDADIDTTGMNPMDALIARSVAREQQRAVAAQQEAQPRPLFTAGVAAPVRTEQTLSAHRRKVVNPLTAVCCGALSTLPNTFSVKSGVMMRLDLQNERSRSETGKGSIPSSGPVMILSTCFESGHVSVCRLTIPPSHAGLTAGAGASLVHPPEAAENNNCADTAGKLRGRDPIQTEVLATVRAFPESAMACVWRRVDPWPAGTEDYIVATSAEGNVQCFRALWGTHARTAEPPDESRGPSSPSAPSCSSSSASDGPSSAGFVSLALLPCWSTSLPKGIGSLCVVGQLLVLGCWDGSLRLYDIRGRGREGDVGARQPFPPLLSASPQPEQPLGSTAGTAKEGGKGEANTGTTGGHGTPCARTLDMSSTDSERYASLVSVLPFHAPSAVNEVTALTSTSLGAVAAFAFDARAPRLYAPQRHSQSYANRIGNGHGRDGANTADNSVSRESPESTKPLFALPLSAATATSPCCQPALGSTTSTKVLAREEARSTTMPMPNPSLALRSPTTNGADAVHVFASASKDGRVALWRVDFAALREAGRLR